MTRLLMLASVVFASAVFAQVEIPHVHENGDVIDADEINQNLDIVAKAVPPRDCSKDQIIKWDGSAWVCASKSIVEKECGGDSVCQANCPTGTTVVSGGCHNVSGTDGSELTLDMYVSRPTSDLKAWICTTNANRDLRAYAICQ